MRQVLAVLQVLLKPWRSSNVWSRAGTARQHLSSFAGEVRIQRQLYSAEGLQQRVHESCENAPVDVLEPQTLSLVPYVVLQEVCVDEDLM